MYITGTVRTESVYIVHLYTYCTYIFYLKSATKALRGLNPCTSMHACINLTFKDNSYK